MNVDRAVMVFAGTVVLVSRALGLQSGQALRTAGSLRMTAERTKPRA